MKKRPAVDLLALTSNEASPMPEAVQRTPPPAVSVQAANDKAKTADLQGLAFKVPPDFRKRFRQHAANADLKLNELLFAALDAWEEKQGLK